jgi:hypothetical protein
MKQHEQVIKVMTTNGGYATLGFLNQQVDVSNWGTKTPFASIRRIVQDEKLFFKIKPGLWGLKHMRDRILDKFQLRDELNVNEKEKFNHSYYQGLLLEIGNLKGFNTYIPAQDKNKMFLENKLGNIANSSEIFDFSYPYVVSRAKSIDVIWFNERKMPSYFFEIEHSTNIEHSLIKFVDLQDFYSKFYIIAAKEREQEFHVNMKRDAFSMLMKHKRVEFKDYETISALHTKTFEILALGDL